MQLGPHAARACPRPLETRLTSSARSASCQSSHTPPCAQSRIGRPVQSMLPAAPQSIMRTRDYSSKNRQHYRENGSMRTKPAPSMQPPLRYSNRFRAARESREGSQTESHPPVKAAAQPAHAENQTNRFPFATYTKRNRVQWKAAFFESSFRSKALSAKLPA